VIKSKSDKRRTYVADEYSEIKDKSCLYYTLPCEKGYIVNWDVQLQIWNRLFGSLLNVDYQNSRLVLTDPNCISRAFVDNKINEIVFENYQFASFLKTSTSSIVARGHLSDSDCALVVDSGYSFTHIIPFVRGKIICSGIIRIDIGGKALTNQLKEWISYRQINVMDETCITNSCKEDVCFVSTNFNKDIRQINRWKIEYILPDFHNLYNGHILSDKSNINEDLQLLRLGVERIAIPELLFHPSDIGINQMGIAEAIYESVLPLSKELQHSLLKNIILVGGNANFQNYEKRIGSDLRSLADESFEIDLYLPKDPIIYPWECAKNLFTDGLDNEFCSKFVSRTEYNEHGSNICYKRFYDFC